MAETHEYICDKCGNKLIVSDNLFFYDSELKVTVAYPLLFSTASLGADSMIKGQVGETYCPICKKFIRIYEITKINDNIENACEIVKQGINNGIDKKLMEINKLKAIKKREKYVVKKKEDENTLGIYGNSYYSVIFPELNNGYVYKGDSGLTEQEVIEKALNSFHEQVDFILDFHIKDYERDIGVIYHVIDMSNNINNDYNFLDRVKCPECHAKINRFINEKTPCPKCGGELSLINIIDAH